MPPSEPSLPHGAAILPEHAIDNSALLVQDAEGVTGIFDEDWALQLRENFGDTANLTDPIYENHWAFEMMKDSNLAHDPFAAEAKSP